MANSDSVKNLFIFFVHRLAYNTRAKNKKTNPSCCFICGKGKLIHFVEIDRILPFRGQTNVRDCQEVSIENLGNGLFERDLAHLASLENKI